MTMTHRKVQARKLIYICSHIYVCLDLMFSYFSHVQLLPTLWTVAHQAHLSMGFSRQARILEWLPYPMSPVSPALQANSSPTEPPGKPGHIYMCLYMFFLDLFAYRAWSQTALGSVYIPVSHICFVKYHFH